MWTDKGNLVFVLLAGSVFMLLVALLVIFLFIRYRQKQHQHALFISDIRYRHEQELMQAKMEIQAHTLHVIGQEIHDNIGQVLSLVKIYLNTMPDNVDALVQEKLKTSKDLVSKVIIDLRSLSTNLASDAILQSGLQAALENELSQLKKMGQFIVDFQVTGKEYRLEPSMEIIVFRIVQESLHNIIKHAVANRVIIHIEYHPENFKMLISDDGRGFEWDRIVYGMGLKNLRQRANVIGAHLDIHSKPQEGTSIRFVLPLTEAITYGKPGIG